MNCSLTENNLGRLERGLCNEGNNEDPREVLQEMQKREWSESAPTERDSEEGGISWTQGSSLGRVLSHIGGHPALGHNTRATIPLSQFETCGWM